MMLQVWQLDTHGRNVLRGYGFRHLPSTPGFSEVSVRCWRPSGSMQVPQLDPAITVTSSFKGTPVALLKDRVDSTSSSRTDRDWPPND